MMNFSEQIASHWDFRRRVHEMRRHHGDRDWLTIVGGVTAEGYRPAGMGPGEFADALRHEMTKRGELRLNFRKREVMRLRDGFDGCYGTIRDEQGVGRLELNFDGGTYRETSSKPELVIRETLRSSLLIVGGMNRHVEALGLSKLPRCLRGGAGRLGRLSHERNEWGGHATRIAVTPRFETLALMPDEIADELGIEHQSELGTIPWAGVRAEAAAAVRAPAPVEARLRPALRLV